MKKLAAITLLLLSFSVLSTSIAFTPESSAQSPVARCNFKERTSESGTIGLLICEPSKEVPKQIVDRIPSNLRNMVQEFSTKEAPTDKERQQESSLLGGYYVGADFDCGNDTACANGGWTAPYSALYVDWYRYNWVHVNDEYDECTEQTSCWYFTYYNPSSSHEAQRVDVWSESWHTSIECSCTNYEWCFVWDYEP